MAEDNAKQLILIVDDTPENIDILAGILRSKYEIKAAINGKKALKIADTDPRPDLILLDVIMPGLSGYEVCRRLKADSATSDIPVIFITSKSEASDEKQGFELGAVDYITRPLSPPVVLSRIKTHLQLYDQNRALEEKVRQRTAELETSRIETVRSEAHLRTLIDALPDMAWLKDQTGVYLSCNAQFGHFFDVTEAEIIGKTDYDFVDGELADLFKKRDKKTIATGKSQMNEEKFIYANGDTVGFFETIRTPIYDAEGNMIGVLGVGRDITDRKQKGKLQAAQLRFIEYSTGHSTIELLQKFLDEAEALTDSEIGFYHFVENDQNTLSPPTWSTNTLTSMCSAEGEGLHYPISQAGVWVDSVKKGEPVIHNDYANLPHPKGLSEGHAPLIRELVMPVTRGGKIVAILGVGNKKTDYNKHDVEMIQQLADHAWETIVSKRAEERTNQSERFLDAIVENIPNMIFVKDAKDLRFVRFNKAGEDLIGFSREDLIGKNDYDFFPREEADFFTEKDRKVLESRTFIDIPDEPIQTRTRGARQLHTTKIPILDENGHPEYLLGISEDITERKQLEEQLRQTQKMESIGNLAGGIAHDFNNILFPIVGLSEMLLEDLPPDSLEYENAQEILKAGIRGSHLVKQILAFSRQSEHKMIPVRIQQILKEVLKLSRSTIPTDIKITDAIQKDCGLVEADPTQIHQVAMNLITNAYHAVEGPGGEISVVLRQAQTQPDSSAGESLTPGRYAMLSISDNGCGIAADVFDNIFEPYFTTKGQGKGTGLGLAVVHGIVKEHKGDIEVYSDEGKGTTFNIYLPLMERSVEAEPVKKVEIPRAVGERILLIDDEEMVARLEKQMLERLGYRVNSYISSIDALDAFRANPNVFDLAVTDMTMPNMTGDQLAQELLTIREDIPIIVCTGFSERINKERAESIGIKGFLMKPVVKSEMAQMVRKVLDEAKSDAQQ